jgi:hypothetical protein
MGIRVAASSEAWRWRKGNIYAIPKPVGLEAATRCYTNHPQATLGSAAYLSYRNDGYQVVCPGFFVDLK